MKKPEKSLKNTCKNILLVALALLLALLTLLSWDIGLAAGGTRRIDTPLAQLRSLLPVGDGGYIRRAGETPAAYPVCIAVSTPSGLTGAAYQEALVGTIYESVRPLWVAAFAGEISFTTADEAALCEALKKDTLLAEYTGNVPFSLLVSWFGGAPQTEQNVNVGSLVLTKDGVLFVRDRSNGHLYQAAVSVNLEQWAQATEALTASPCDYAGLLDMDVYSRLYPETLVMRENQVFEVLTARAPNFFETNSDESIQDLLEAFGYNRYLKSYLEGDGVTQVFVGNNSALRVSADGTVRYKATTLTGGLTAYQTAAEETTAFAARVDFANKLLGNALHSIGSPGSVQLQSMSADEEKDICFLVFAQSVGGVLLTDQTLAHFEFHGGLLASAELHLQVLEPTGEKLYVLPAAQAAATATGTARGYAIAYQKTEKGRLLARAFLTAAEKGVSNAVG